MFRFLSRCLEGYSLFLKSLGICQLKTAMQKGALVILQHSVTQLQAYDQESCLTPGRRTFNEKLQNQLRNSTVFQNWKVHYRVQNTTKFDSIPGAS
jgi:hypothetical protein